MMMPMMMMRMNNIDAHDELMMMIMHTKDADRVENEDWERIMMTYVQL